MKRVQLLIILLLSALLVCSCASPSSSGNTSETAGTDDSTASETPAVDYLALQTDMANYMTGGGALIADGWIYTYGWGADTAKPLFLKMRTDGSDDTVFRYFEFPQYINIKGEYIYAVMENFDDEKSNIYRYRLGGDDEKLLVKDASYLSIIDDKMYYCKCSDMSKMKDYRMADLDGKNEEIILDKEIYFPYIVDNQLYYQDDADNETIHVYNLETKEDTQITTARTYSYILNDGYMYCIQDDDPREDDEKTDCLIAKIDLNTFKRKVLYEGTETVGLAIKDDFLYFVNANDEFRLYKIDKDGNNIGIVAQDAYCREPYIFDDKLLYLKCGKDYKYAEDLYICNLDGSDKKCITKKY